MADFALWATAAETALSFEPGSFMAAYMRNRQATNDVALEASPTALMMLHFAEESKQWTGTATELLEALSRRKGTGALPHSPNGLARLLRRLAPNLRTAGANIDFKRDPDSSRQRLITITHKA
jgi:hypothetical protein